jgi:hypothetical protein
MIQYQCPHQHLLQHCLNKLSTAVTCPVYLMKGMTLHDQRSSTSVAACLPNQVAVDTYRKNQIPPDKQTFNKSVKIRSVFFTAFGCLFIHYLTTLSEVHTKYCQMVGWLLNKEMEYRHLPGGTVDNHEKSQLNNLGQSQDSNREPHAYKSVALSVLSNCSVYVLQPSNK